jgi:hypothetical protein
LFEITILFSQHAITQNFVQENKKHKNNNVQDKKPLEEEECDLLGEFS